MVQLELFEGPHTRRQIAIHQLLAFDPAGAKTVIESLPSDSWTRKGEEGEVRSWIGLEEELAARLARAPEEGLAQMLREAWKKLEWHASRIVRAGDVLPDLRRSLFRKALAQRAAPGGSSPAFMADGTPSGWLYLGAGDVATARPLLEEALEKRPQDGLTLGAMGDLLHVVGAKLRSRSLYREAFYWEPLRVDRDQIADPEVRRLPLMLVESGLVPDGDPPATWACAYGCVVGIFPLPRHDDPAALERAKAAFARLADRPEKLAVGLFRARLFYNGMVLAQALGHGSIYGLDLGEVRRRMKLSHPRLFGLHMEELAAHPPLPLE